MDLRVWEDGESECRAVTVRIGVELISNITPHKSGQNSIGCLIFHKCSEISVETADQFPGLDGDPALLIAFVSACA